MARIVSSGAGVFLADTKNIPTRVHFFLAVHAAQAAVCGFLGSGSAQYPQFMRRLTLLIPAYHCWRNACTI